MKTHFEKHGSLCVKVCNSLGIVHKLHHHGSESTEKKVTSSQKKQNYVKSPSELPMHYTVCNK